MFTTTSTAAAAVRNRDEGNAPVRFVLFVIAGVLAILSLGAALAVGAEGSDAGAAQAPAVTDTLVSANGAPRNAEGLKPEVEGSLADFVDPAHRKEFEAMMADPGQRSKFFEAFQGGLATASGTEGGDVRNVLAYGFNRDHVWVTASYADMARGLIWGAVNYCKRYVPAWVCNAAGNWLTSLARGYAPMSNHGVWGALYWNRYTGGRW